MSGIVRWHTVHSHRHRLDSCSCDRFRLHSCRSNSCPSHFDDSGSYRCHTGHSQIDRNTDCCNCCCGKLRFQNTDLSLLVDIRSIVVEWACRGRYAAGWCSFRNHRMAIESPGPLQTLAWQAGRQCTWLKQDSKSSWSFIPLVSVLQLMVTRRLATMSMFAVVSIPHRVTRTLETIKCEPCAKTASKRFLQDMSDIQCHRDESAHANDVKVIPVVIELKSPV